MENCPERLFVGDLAETLLVQAREAKTLWLQSKGTENEAFDAGVVQGYWQILTSLKSRILIYGIELEKYDIRSLEPDDIWHEETTLESLL
jgi:hypothetical protein